MPGDAAATYQALRPYLIDPTDLLLGLVQPLTLEVALVVEQEVKTRCAETDALLRQQMERARY